MINHLAKKTGTSAASEENGLLLASGLITGEALIGIMVAVPVFITGSKDWWPQYEGFGLLGIFTFFGIISWLYKSVTE